MAENESTLFFSYASLFNDDLNCYIPSKYQPIALFSIIGALVAWSEMALSQTRELTNRIIEAASSSSDPHTASVAGDLMRHAADAMGGELSSNAPQNYLSTFASTLMTMLQIPSNIEVHSHIVTLVSSFSRAWVDAHPVPVSAVDGTKEAHAEAPSCEDVHSGADHDGTSEEVPQEKKAVSGSSRHSWVKNGIIAVLAILCVCLLTWGLSLNSSLSTADLKIDTLSEENSSLNDQLSEVQAQNSTLSGQADSLREQLSSLESEFDFYHMHAAITLEDATYYHMYDCPLVAYAEQSSRPFQIWSLDTVRNVGYIPCPVCFGDIDWRDDPQNIRDRLDKMIADGAGSKAAVSAAPTN